MKINCVGNRRRAIAIFGVLVLLVVFLVVVGGLAILLIKAAEKLKPKPDPNPDGHFISAYDGQPESGGTVVGAYWYPVGAPAPDTNFVLSVQVFADSSPSPETWTNLVYSNNCSMSELAQATDMQTLMSLDVGSTNGTAPMRFYKVVTSAKVIP